MKILIAEDESVSRSLLMRTLEKWGYEVIATEDGAAALEAFQKEKFSIVITDWMMPKMDGIELVRNIRSLDCSDYVYVIMLTAKSDKEDLVEGMNAGADDFVSKPFDKDELRVRISAGKRVIGLEKDLSKRNKDLEDANQRMRVDLEAAAQIQKALLPDSAPETDEVQIAWKFFPCDELAGDILNVFKLSEKELGFYVLDVSGHGVPAALLAVTLSRMLSPVADEASLLYSTNGTPGKAVRPPLDVATQLNKRFQVDAQHGQYFTFLYGMYDRENRKIRYVSAGHPGVVFASKETGVKILEVPSLPIGFMEETIYEEAIIDMKPGDRIYIYSDGIPEAEGAESELFGKERMISSLNKTLDMTIEESLDVLLADVESFTVADTFRDDVSLLGIEIKELDE
ncbi:MAG: PP2C family protein-serine/threonine phosphatase [Calditrichia bacterium]